MNLPDRVANVPDTLRRIASEQGTAALRAYVDTLGYNDTGLICAYLRAQGEAYLASRVEGMRFK
jgi:hypothetical protein